MIDNRYTITSDATDEIELLLTRFDRDRDQGPADLTQYLPPSDDPAYAAVVTELARIDLEHGFNEGKQPFASNYIESFPAVFEDLHHRTQLVFEEYRLRRRGGEDVTAIDVATRYEIDGSRWPQLKLGPDQPRSESRTFTKQQLAVPHVHYPRAGETFAGYPLVSRIGEGAFSRVFLARQPDLAGRLVVLKLTPLSTDESDRLASLQHTAIIPVYSVHREGDLSCICMPFLGATTLADLSACGHRWASLDGPAEELVSTIVERRRSTIGLVAESADQPAAAQHEPLSENESSQAASPAATSEVGLAAYSRLGYVDALVQLGIGAVEGLAHAHQRGIIHRDLKPANILVTDDGSPVLLDFNLAVSSQEPKTRVVGGTLPYMSPQQLESMETGAASDTRDDIFSMGVIFYELLSGRLPFDCPANGEAFEMDSVVAARRKKPPSLRSFNSGVSPGLEAIISRCMAPEPGQRYRDASELLEDLKRHRENLPLKYAPNISARERMTKWFLRHPRLSSASSVASIAAAVIVICSVLIWQHRERIARMSVKAEWEQLQNDLPPTIAALSTPGRETEFLTSGLGDSARLMNQWHVGSEQWKSLADVDRLEAPSAQTLSSDLARLAYLMAAAERDIALTSDAADKAEHRSAALFWNDWAGKLFPDLQPLAGVQKQSIVSRIDGVAIDEDRPGAIPITQNLALQAMWAAESGDAVLFRELTQKQLDQQPTNVTLWFDLALANMRLGDLNEAAASFNVCHRMQPNSLVTLFNRGVCNLQRGELRLARDDFSACLRLNPRLMTPRLNRAVAAHRLGDHRAAMEDLNEVARAGHTTTRMLFLRARVHEALGDSNAAETDREAAMKIPPRDANDWVARGVYRLDDSPEEALTDFKAAMRIQPDDFGAINNAAHVYSERLEEPNRAIELLSRLEKSRPLAASPIASRGIIRARQGNTDVALADARAASKLSPAALEKLQIAGIHALAAERLKDNTLLHEQTRDQAFVWLARALRSDSSLASTASRDSDLASLRGDARFRTLINGAMAVENAARK